MSHWGYENAPYSRMLADMFDNTYAKLPETFFERIQPTPVQNPRLLKFNKELAHDLDIDLSAYSAEQLAQFLSGNQLLPGAEPLAQAYAGHQYGHFVPQLGDGRAVLIGEVIDRQGQRRDIQLKGAGRTRFSRGGDGRAALGPVIREYVLGEAMFHLGIPTTRGLAIVGTGETVRREVPLPGAILTRVAASHIRVGTFEYFASRDDDLAVQTLADYVIDRHYSDLKGGGSPYQRLFAEIVLRQARLVARWTEVGFIHGVMNTDNMTVSGETIDYGPCAFLDEYEPGKIFSAIDQHGRYSFENQPRAAMWNLAVLARCLLPLMDSDEKQAQAKASEALEAFTPTFQNHLMASLKKKMALGSTKAGDDALVRDFFSLMAQTRADYTRTFRFLSGALEEGPAATNLRSALGNVPDLETWLVRWRERCRDGNRPSSQLTQEMLGVNPAYIARNHLVERAIQGAGENDDWTAMEHLLDAVRSPFVERPYLRDMMLAPAAGEKVTVTFCGT